MLRTLGGKASKPQVAACSCSWDTASRGCPAHTERTEPTDSTYNIVYYGIFEYIVTIYRYRSRMVIVGLYWGHVEVMENRIETTIVYLGDMGMMENRMETTIVKWGHVGIVENKMETTI